MAGMLLPGTGTVTCLPCALLFPHLVMTLVCVGGSPAPRVPRDPHALPRMSSPSSSWGLLQWDEDGAGAFPRVSCPFVLSLSPSSPSLQAQG